jgi:hypothetical protein
LSEGRREVPKPLKSLAGAPRQGRTEDDRRVADHCVGSDTRQSTCICSRRSALATGSLSASSGSEILAAEMAYGSAGMQALAGLAAVVPGILAVTGNNTTILTLAALLTLGGTLVLSGSTLSARC